MNAVIRRALYLVDEYSRNPEAHADAPDEVRSLVAALHPALRPLALDAIRTHAASAGVASERVNAGVALEWLSEWVN